MKHIIAFIKHHKLSKVTLALRKIEELTGMSISDVKGCGRGKSKYQTHNSIDDLIDFIPHTRIDIFCRKAAVKNIIETIRENAHTGLRGDGKIYVCSLENAVRISTGESGEKAV